MPGVDFYQTVGGHRFIEGTVPRLIEAMNRLAEATEKANELKEKELGLDKTGEVVPDNMGQDIG